MKCLKCEKTAVQSNFCRSHFINYLENKVRKTIRKYKLAKKTDKIGVAVSGGKDSTTLLHILKKLGYNIEAITVNANIGNYSKQNLKNLQDFCIKYKITLHTISFKYEYGHSLCFIRDILKEKGYNYQSCVICGVLKRNLLNIHSKKLKFDLLATGHNLDDEAQSFLMNVFRNDISRAYRSGPKTGSYKGFVTRIKPLFHCQESEITTYSKLHRFKVKYTRCPLASDAFRMEFRNMLEPYLKKHPDALYNIINFFLSTKPLKEKKVYGTCTLCNEPSSQEICRKCELIRNLSLPANANKNRKH